MDKSTPLEPNRQDWPRRRFLKASGAVAAGWTMMRPELVAGTAANSRIRAGVIGLGGRGRMIAAMVSEQEGFELHALADYFPEVAKQAGAALKVPADRCFSGLSGYRQLLASGVEAVFLETPPYWFPEHAAAALEAKCHVYVAKPIAVDVPGTLHIQETGRRAGQRGQVFWVDFQLRVDPYLTEVIRRVRAGAMGRLGFIRSYYDAGAFPDPPLTGSIESRLRRLIWVNDMALGGGQLLNAGIHALDAALWIADATPRSAIGASALHRPNAHGDAHDVFSVTYKFDGGLVLNHSGNHSSFAGFVCRCQAYGPGSFLETNYAGRTWLRTREDHYPGGEKPDLYKWGARENIRRFYTAIRDGDASNPTLEPSVKSNLLALLGQEACHQQTEVTWEALLKSTSRMQPDLSGLKD